MAAAAIVGGLIASSGSSSSGPTLIATTGPQAGAVQAPAAACTPGQGAAPGLPAPGEPRHDSLTRKPAPIPADMRARYEKAGAQYGIPWALLAGVGMIETNHGATKATSSAGAQGPMQFMPGTWAGFGVDGDGDGRKDVTDPDDAVPAAASYLKASGAPGDYRKALFAYNRANWYVNDVLWYAAQYAGAGAQECSAAPAAGGVPAAAATGLAVERGLQPGALRGMRATAAKFPRIKDWAGRGGRPNKSDHPNGRAVDAMIPGWNTPAGNAYGWEVARWQVANADALGITYVIWDDQVWKKRVGKWAPYTHPNGPTKDANLRHLNHVHVSYAQ